MRVVTFRSEVLRKYYIDREMLRKSGRPCALVLRLKYKGHRYDFAIPMRSNINRSAPRSEYFPLPPRPTTRPGNRHGVHYIKMFPVDRSMGMKFRVDGNAHALLVKSILDKNEKSIISECQKYLDQVANGERAKYGTDIDLLLNILKNG